MDADRLGSYQKFLGQGLDLGPDAFARDAYEQVAPGGHFWAVITPCAIIKRRFMNPS